VKSHSGKRLISIKVKTVRLRSLIATPLPGFERLETPHAIRIPEALKVIGVSRAGHFAHFRVVTPYMKSGSESAFGAAL
jgi:hypothetical protein